MRRRPYAEMPGVGLSTGRNYDLDRSGRDVQALQTPTVAAALSADVENRYRAEIRNLAAIVQNFRLSADAEGHKICSYVDEKLREATSFLDRGEGDVAWVHLFGAATLCRTFAIEPERSGIAIDRINSLLR